MLDAPQGYVYVPVDVAHEYLLQTAHRMERRFRSLWCGLSRDFLSAFEMPTGPDAVRPLVAVDVRHRADPGILVGGEVLSDNFLCQS
ncbi:hypothetical protein ACVWVY_008123 [Bradyrhizobium sp. URHC0002]